MTQSLAPNSLGLGNVALGDRWNMLILREAFAGAGRFQDWLARLPVSDPVLSSRLKDLTALGILAKEQYSVSPPRYEYRLTAQGRDMWQVFVAVWMWDSRWIEHQIPVYAPGVRLRHESCGYTITPLLGCDTCDARGVTPHDITTIRHPDYVYDQSNPPRRYRRTRLPSETQEGVLHSSIDLLGDRWSTSVLSAAFLGARRFGDFQRDIGRIPPLLLTQRLNTFVEQGVLRRQPLAEGGRRHEYRLNPKGLDFFGIFANSIAWSRAAFQDEQGPPLILKHRPCGQDYVPRYVCNVCNEVLERRELSFVSRSSETADTEPLDV
ncbi:winged helix-turn-helix transcriptional regulator [Streptosporangium sp. NPDC087985]|uniref:winged helix-turn-helix transcriptional regulator n=1 Tax=Streptosporangium sp. NPDC087985 TaxID=3366196 RepID=UPI003803340B